MSDDDRKTFFGSAKPVVDPNIFPVAMADSLPSECKTWLIETYTPAFISHMLSRSEYSNGWRGQFDEQQKDKIWYWWTGQVRVPLTSQGPSADVPWSLGGQMPSKKSRV